MIEYKRNSCPDPDNSMPVLYSASDTLDDDSEYDSEESEQVLGKEKPRASRSVAYRVSDLIPLSTSPAWDEINIRLIGSDSLTGLCNEAHFARSHLIKTMSSLLKGSTQAKAALFCLKQIQSADITKDLQIAFAKPLPHSLFHAEELPELRIAIQQLRTQHLIYQRLPVETRKAITDYLSSTSGSRTAARTFPNVPPTHPHPSDTITKSSTPTTSQIPSTTQNFSTAHRTGESLSPTTTHPMVHLHQLPANPPTKQNIKASENQFGSVQRIKLVRCTAVQCTYHQRIFDAVSAPPLLSPLA